MSCEFCEKADFGCFRAELDSGYAHISLAGGCSRFLKEEQFAYCPVCGEALRETPAKKKTAAYEFCEEVEVIFPDCDGSFERDEECDPVGVCVVKCLSCGWHMYGDGWWGGDNFMRAEQIPRFCGHCGKEFRDDDDERKTL